MTRRNFMTDDATVAALDRFRAEVQARGGAELSRSEVLRAMIRGLDGALSTLRIRFPCSQNEEQLREALRRWIVSIYTSTQRKESA